MVPASDEPCQTPSQRTPYPAARGTGVVGRPWFVVGAALLAAAVMQPLVAFLVEPAWAVGLGAAMAAELVTGREAAIPLAVAAGVPAAWIAVTSILQNLALAALIVPVAVRGAHAVKARRGAWGLFLHNLHAGASSQVHQGRSAWALFGFMLLPFLPNGAVMAGIIGSLAGIEGRRLGMVLAAAVAITAAAWSFGYVWLAEALASLHPGLRLLPAVLACTAVTSWAVMAAFRARRTSLAHGE